jgi:hypothetical protein
VLNIVEVKQRIEQLTNKIHASTRAMPTYGDSKDDGTPHIEVDDSSYYYICSDRGIRSVQKTSDLETLLYWAIKDITWSTALDYATAHRDPKKKFREVLFDYQLSLLELINHDWKERVEKEIVQILKNSPL